MLHEPRLKKPVKKEIKLKSCNPRPVFCIFSCYHDIPVRMAGESNHTAANFFKRKINSETKQTSKNYVSGAAVAAPCQPNISVRMAGEGAPYCCVLQHYGYYELKLKLHFTDISKLLEKYRNKSIHHYFLRIN